MKFKLVAFLKKSYMLLNNYYLIFKQALFILNYDVHHKLKVCAFFCLLICAIFYFRLWVILVNSKEL